MDSPARGAHWNRAARIDREPELAALVDIPARAVNNDPADSLRLRSQRQESAPTRSIGSPAIVDHNHVPGLSRVDGQRAKMLFWFVQTHRFDFHGYSTANNLRQGHIGRTPLLRPSVQTERSIPSATAQVSSFNKRSMMVLAPLDFLVVGQFTTFCA